MGAIAIAKIAPARGTQRFARADAPPHVKRTNPTNPADAQTTGEYKLTRSKRK
jgi:hypothetical protein